MAAQVGHCLGHLVGDAGVEHAVVAHYRVHQLHCSGLRGEKSADETRLGRGAQIAGVDAVEFIAALSPCVELSAHKISEIDRLHGLFAGEAGVVGQAGGGHGAHLRAHHGDDGYGDSQRAAAYAGYIMHRGDGADRAFHYVHASCQLREVSLPGFTPVSLYSSILASTRVRYQSHSR